MIWIVFLVCFWVINHQIDAKICKRYLAQKEPVNLRVIEPKSNHPNLQEDQTDEKTRL